MKYKENDLKVGTKLLCTKSSFSHWIVGKYYEITLNNLGISVIKDELNIEAYKSYMLDCLNGEHKLVKFELIKEENNMQEFKVGDLVEVLENKSFAYKNKFNLFEKGDIAVVKEVHQNDVRIGECGFANFIGKSEIKKVEQSPELTEYEEELVLRLAEKIQLKDVYLKQIEQSKNNIKYNEKEIEKMSKEIKEITKKLLTK